MGLGADDALGYLAIGRGAIAEKEEHGWRLMPSQRNREKAIREAPLLEVFMVLVVEWVE